MESDPATAGCPAPEYGTSFAILDEEGYGVPNVDRTREESMIFIKFKLNEFLYA